VTRDERFVFRDWWAARGFRSFLGVPVMLEGSLLAAAGLSAVAFGGALVAAGARPEVVSESLYERRPADALRWLGAALARVEVSEDGRLGWLALPAGLVPERVVESEELVNYPRSVASVRVACLLRERDGQVKVSLRGKGDVDVQKIAAQFGGGGHVNAAGCTVAGPLTDAMRAVLDAARRAIDESRAS